MWAGINLGRNARGKIATGPPTLLSQNMCITRSLSPFLSLAIFFQDIERDLSPSARLSGRDQTERESCITLEVNRDCIDHSSRPLVMTRNDAQYIIEFNYQLADEARSDPKFENSINRDRQIAPSLSADAASFSERTLPGIWRRYCNAVAGRRAEPAGYSGIARHESRPRVSPRRGTVCIRWWCKTRRPIA